MDGQMAFAEEVLAGQPFSKLLGTRIVEFGDGAAVLELEIREDLRQQHGYVHGGLLGYLADSALTFAAGAVVGGNVLTSGFTIDYLRPAVDGTLRAEGRVIRAGRGRVVSRCEIFTVDERGEPLLCAVAQGDVAVTGPAVT
ncbi:PaaI family thioesterase [Actinocorallia longicatena]|uniref:PaaI family thioesterase n=1 Tax=Actinocorallia longicatena TaxID=111803 RepID=A0ABP6QCG6_9ACTN